MRALYDPIAAADSVLVRTLFPNRHRTDIQR